MINTKLYRKSFAIEEGKRDSGFVGPAGLWVNNKGIHGLVALGEQKEIGFRRY